jgi:hypothetical protein
MPPSMGSIFGMKCSGADRNAEEFFYNQGRCVGYTNRDEAEIDKQGRTGNLDAPSAEQCIKFSS